MTPRCWEFFRELYEAAGYRVLTPPWPGMKGEVEEVRRDPSGLAGVGVSEIADHCQAFVRGLDEAPILMGHSFGGLIVQLLLDRGLGAAGVAIDSAPPKGILRLPWSVIKASSPVLSNPANFHRTVALSFEQFRYGFANVMPDQLAREAYKGLRFPARAVRFSRRRLPTSTHGQ